MHMLLLAAFLVIGAEQECQVIWRNTLTGESGGTGWMLRTDAEALILKDKLTVPFVRDTLVCKGEFGI